ARTIGDFLTAATRSLDVALYDLRLSPATAELVTGALVAASQRGVAVRLAYNVDHGKSVPVPPPPQADPRLVESLPVPTRAIPGVPDLMHHKYVVRDGAQVWTGSTNWTDDSWPPEENVIAVVDLSRSEEVLGQWRANGNAEWKEPSLRAVLTRAPFSGKHSTPYAPGSVHDYMHAKVTVCDDTVFLGSFNLSHSGEQNAENVLEIADPSLAGRL